MQENIKKRGEYVKAKSEELGINLPNDISIPYLKIVEEIGEVADVLIRKYGIPRKGKEISEEEFKRRLGEELSDVIICLTHLANFSKIDLDEVMKKKLEELASR